MGWNGWSIAVTCAAQQQALDTWASIGTAGGAGGPGHRAQAVALARPPGCDPRNDCQAARVLLPAVQCEAAALFYPLGWQVLHGIGTLRATRLQTIRQTCNVPPCRAQVQERPAYKNGGYRLRMEDRSAADLMAEIGRDPVIWGGHTPAGAMTALHCCSGWDFVH